MYRFNGLDGRLNRMLETTCLIFESMEGLDRYATCLQPNKLSTLGVNV